MWKLTSLIGGQTETDFAQVSVFSLFCKFQSLRLQSPPPVAMQVSDSLEAKLQMLLPCKIEAVWSDFTLKWQGFKVGKQGRSRSQANQSYFKYLMPLKFAFNTATVIPNATKGILYKQQRKRKECNGIQCGIQVQNTSCPEWGNILFRFNQYLLLQCWQCYSHAAWHPKHVLCGHTIHGEFQILHVPMIPSSTGSKAHQLLWWNTVWCFDHQRQSSQGAYEDGNQWKIWHPAKKVKYLLRYSLKEKCTFKGWLSRMPDSIPHVQSICKMVRLAPHLQGDHPLPTWQLGWIQFQKLKWG